MGQITRRKMLGVLGTLSVGSVAASAVTAENQAMATELKADYQTEVLVCGGGPAGIAAATMAARLGRKVLLLERYGRLGGMAIQACVFPLLGNADSPFLREVHAKTGGIYYEPSKLDLIYADFVMNAGAKVLLHSYITETLKDGNRVVGVRVMTKQGPLSVLGDVVIDATGDGDVAAGAGAEFEVGRKSDGLMQPMSIMYMIDGMGPNAQLCGGEYEARIIKVGDKSWEQIVMDAHETGELPRNIGVIRTYPLPRQGAAVVNTTQINYVSGLKVEDLTKAEFEGRRQAPMIVDFLKKHMPGYENVYITQMPAVVGVRETRRILGHQYLTLEDLMAGRSWDDAVVRRAEFGIDIHNPDGGGQAAHRTEETPQGDSDCPKPYDIPLGCLIPKGLDGLLVAGRCISGSHEAHASYRVQNICLAIGSAAGTAAALALRNRCALTAVNAAEVRDKLGVN